MGLGVVSGPEYDGRAPAPRLPGGAKPCGQVMTVDYSEPFQRAIELIGRRWTGSVIRALLQGPVRFNTLLAGIPGVSDRVLTERLKELVDHGIVKRLVDPGPPVHVDYQLTDRGSGLGRVVAAIDAWVGEGE